jgi:hypothetical protein
VPDLGVRLQLLIGPTIPLPAPYAVVDSLVSLEVTNNDRGRDGFQMTFSLGKDSLLDYGLLLSGIFDPPARVIIIVIVNAIPQVLIDGVITNHQVLPSNRPGESSLHVTGEDVSLMMDLEEKSTTYPNQPDSVIVTRLIATYSNYGLVPVVTPTTDVPIILDRLPTQQKTDLAHIRDLAQRNGFVFYVEPTAVPTVNTAYWGLDNRIGIPQPALTMNMGPDTNVDSPITFQFNALGPVSPQVFIVEPITKLRIPIPLPTSLHPPLSRSPVASLRKTVPRDVANLNMVQATLRALSAATESSDAVTASGELDGIRYGGVLRARRLVGVRGVGQSYDGVYYVQRVSHRIKRGEYKQSFTLTREGRGSLTPMLVP